MGTFTVPIEVGDLEGNHFMSMDALVDTDADPSTAWCLAAVLDKVGVTIHEARANSC